MYLFSNMKFDPFKSVIEVGLGKTIHLTPHEAEALACLAEGGQQGATEEELEKRIWPDTNVNESALRGVIGSLRKKLGDEKSSGQWVFINTFTSKGYGLKPVVIKAGETDISALLHHSKGVPPPRATQSFLGRENDLIAVRRALTTKGNGLSFVVLHGIPGVGKTTLTQAIAYDRELGENFPDGVLWTSLGRQPDIVQRMADWAVYFEDHSFLGLPTVNSARSRLATLLRGRRMLIIVDDAWNAEEIAPFIQATPDGCAVLTTTRKPVLATAFAAENARALKLPPLSETDAFELLNRLAGAAVQNYPSECRQLLIEIGNLPLAIHVAGQLLANEYALGIPGLIEAILRHAESRILSGSIPPTMRQPDDLRPEQHVTINEVFATSTDLLNAQDRQRLRMLGTYKRRTLLSPNTLSALWKVQDPIPTVRALVEHGLLEARGDGWFTLHEMIANHAATLTEYCR